MFDLKGIIKYGGREVRAMVDYDTIKYYRNLLPKAYYVKPPRSEAHVSIVRYFEEPDRRYWNFLDGSAIRVSYIPGVQTDGTYFWLDCYSEDIGIIRKRLGLSTFRNNDSRYPIYNCYHITIGNTK